MDWERVECLRDELGADAFEDVLDLFLAETDQKVAELQAGTGAGDVAADMHFLKGAALNLGFDELASACERAEMLATAGRPEAINLPAILDCFARSRAELVAYRATPQPRSGTPPGRDWR